MEKVLEDPIGKFPQGTLIGCLVLYQIAEGNTGREPTLLFGKRIPVQNAVRGVQANGIAVGRGRSLHTGYDFRKSFRCKEGRLGKDIRGSREDAEAQTEPRKLILPFPDWRVRARLLSMDEQVTLELGLGVELVLKKIPAGEFWMGERGLKNWDSTLSEPVHRELVEEFWMGETPVTQAQFACWRPDHKNVFDGQPNHPVERVNWGEAEGFCRWLEEKSGFEARLPTEVQWEYACRAGTRTEYWSGDGEAALAEVGWYAENSGDRTHAVKGKPPNAWGLYDMHGNVWEWCADGWDKHRFLRGAEKSQLMVLQRLIRGGSYDSEARFCRSAFRAWRGSTLRIWFLGFRVCVVGCPAKPSQTRLSENENEREPGRLEAPLRPSALEEESSDIALRRRC